MSFGLMTLNKQESMTDMKNHVFGKRLERVQDVLEVHVQTEVTEEFQYTGKKLRTGNHTGCLIILNVSIQFFFICERLRNYCVTGAGKSASLTSKSYFFTFREKDFQEQYT